MNDTDRKFAAIARWSGRRLGHPASLLVDICGNVTAIGYEQITGCASKRCGGAAYHATENGPPELRGSTLYTPLPPCEACEGTVRYMGIERIVTYDAS